MTKNVALVQNGVVVNIVTVADDWPTPADPMHAWMPPATQTGIVLAPDQSVAIGWTYEGAGVFAPPSAAST